MEWNKGTILTLVGATAIVLGALLGWWAITLKMGAISQSIYFNPLYGMSMFGLYIIPPTLLSIICGILALTGGGLTFGAVKKPVLAIIGGVIAIAGLILFIAAFYIDQIGTNILTTDAGLFDSFSDSGYDFVTSLGFGWFIALGGVIVGIIGSRLIEPEY